MPSAGSRSSATDRRSPLSPLAGAKAGQDSRDERSSAYRLPFLWFSSSRGCWRISSISRNWRSSSEAWHDGGFRLIRSTPGLRPCSASETSFASARLGENVFAGSSSMTGTLRVGRIDRRQHGAVRRRAAIALRPAGENHAAAAGSDKRSMDEAGHHVPSFYAFGDETTDEASRFIRR